MMRPAANAIRGTGSKVANFSELRQVSGPLSLPKRTKVKLRSSVRTEIIIIPSYSNYVKVMYFLYSSKGCTWLLIAPLKKIGISLLRI